MFYALCAFLTVFFVAGGVASYRIGRTDNGGDKALAFFAWIAVVLSSGAVVLVEWILRLLL